MAYSLFVDESEGIDPTLTELDRQLAGSDTVAGWRDALGTANRALKERFLAGESVTQLVLVRAQLIDHLLVHIWTKLAPELADKVALIAVGGYGRGELHPCSDVDFMLLLGDALPASTDARLSNFVATLWDVGLEAGHSVRSVADCAREAAGDITVTTTLMESRLLAGPAALLDAMFEATSPQRMWPSDRFFLAKREEQQARHHRYDDTAYKLEPNVKGSPGGLRDIQMIGWIARRHFGTRRFEELVQHDFLTATQLQRRKIKAKRRSSCTSR